MENRRLPGSCLTVLVLFLGTLALYILVGVTFAPVFLLAALVFLLGILGATMYTIWIVAIAVHVSTDKRKSK